MPRAARIVVPGASHHVTQRGNNRQDVFFVEDDRRVYLELLREQSERFGFRIEAYCLMTNHIHVVGVPAREESLAKAIGRTHFLYSQYINDMHGRSGHLWQNRFFSCAMDEAHAMNAMAYVELNPVRARLSKHPWDFEWSSARAHCCGDADSAGLCLNLRAWFETVSANDWKRTLTEFRRDAAAQSAICRHTLIGRPLGSDSFLSKIEHALGRRVRPLPIGRQQGWRKEPEEVAHATTANKR